MLAQERLGGDVLKVSITIVMIFLNMDSYFVTYDLC